MPVFWVTPGFQQLTVINNLGPEQPVCALYRPKPDPQQAPLSFAQIAAYHVETIRGVRPNGPYAIIGYCINGAVAFEAARELAAQGEQVAQLIMIDPSDPALSCVNSLPRPVASEIAYQCNRMAFHIERVRRLPLKEKIDYVSRSITGIRNSIKETAQTKLFQKSQEKEAARQLPDFLLDVHQSDIYAFKMHTLHRFLGSGVVLRPKMVPRGALDYANRRWAQLVADPLSIDEVAGDSESMWDNPDAKGLSEAIAHYLNHQGN